MVLLVFPTDGARPSEVNSIQNSEKYNKAFSRSYISEAWPRGEEIFSDLEQDLDSFILHPSPASHLTTLECPSVSQVIVSACIWVAELSRIWPKLQAENAAALALSCSCLSPLELRTMALSKANGQRRAGVLLQEPTTAYLVYLCLCLVSDYTLWNMYPSGG